MIRIYYCLGIIFMISFIYELFRLNISTRFFYFPPFFFFSSDICHAYIIIFMYDKKQVSTLITDRSQENLSSNVYIQCIICRVFFSYGLRIFAFGNEMIFFFKDIIFLSMSTATANKIDYQNCKLIKFLIAWIIFCKKTSSFEIRYSISINLNNFLTI